MGGITQSQQSGFCLYLGASLVFPPLKTKTSTQSMRVFCLKMYHESEDNLRVISKLSQEELVMTACLPESHRVAERSSRALSSSEEEAKELAALLLTDTGGERQKDELKQEEHNCEHVRSPGPR